MSVALERETRTRKKGTVWDTDPRENISTNIKKNRDRKDAHLNFIDCFTDCIGARCMRGASRCRDTVSYGTHRETLEHKLVLFGWRRSRSIIIKLGNVNQVILKINIIFQLNYTPPWVSLNLTMLCITFAAFIALHCLHCLHWHHSCSWYDPSSSPSLFVFFLFFFFPSPFRHSLIRWAWQDARGWTAGPDCVERVRSCQDGNGRYVTAKWVLVRFHKNPWKKVLPTKK